MSADTKSVTTGGKTLVAFLVKQDTRKRNEDTLKSLLFLQAVLGDESPLTIRFDVEGTIAFYEQFGQFWSDVNIRSVDGGVWSITEAEALP